jgi:3-deoxy-manno-octulosonate cytidylyltransferase (CMP-KDO synthetase)
MTPIIDETQIANPNVVKVVTTSNGEALYFSRSPFPTKEIYKAKGFVFVISASMDIERLP